MKPFPSSSTKLTTVPSMSIPTCKLKIKENDIKNNGNSPHWMMSPF